MDGSLDTKEMYKEFKAVRAYLTKCTSKLDKIAAVLKELPATKETLLSDKAFLIFLSDKLDKALRIYNDTDGQ